MSRQAGVPAGILQMDVRASSLACKRSRMSGLAEFMSAAFTRSELLMLDASEKGRMREGARREEVRCSGQGMYRHVPCMYRGCTGHRLEPRLKWDILGGDVNGMTIDKPLFMSIQPYNPRLHPAQDMRSACTR